MRMKYGELIISFFFPKENILVEFKSQAPDWNVKTSNNNKNPNLILSPFDNMTCLFAKIKCISYTSSNNLQLHHKH